MKIKDKIFLFEKLNYNEILGIDFFYDVLEKCDAVKYNYNEYMTTSPIDCDKELLRLPTADYDLCCALLTMLLREGVLCGKPLPDKRLLPRFPAHWQ